MSTTEWQTDPVLAPLLAMAAADPDVEGVVLSGSRGAGVHDHESDYDVAWVLDDAAFAERSARGESFHVRHHPIDARVDVGYTCLRELSRIAAEASWELPAFATAHVLYNKAGRVAHMVNTMALMPADRARADVLGWFDAYLNAYYRSLKAWRRGNMLGAQLQAAESAMHLVQVLFALERRWPPYHDRLATQLDLLHDQGWAAGYLQDALLRLVQTGDPVLQQVLEMRTEALLRSRGFQPAMWDGEIERVKAWRFDDGSKFKQGARD